MDNGLIARRQTCSGCNQPMLFVKREGTDVSILQLCLGQSMEAVLCFVTHYILSHLHADGDALRFIVGVFSCTVVCCRGSHLSLQEIQSGAYILFDREVFCHESCEMERYIAENS